MISNFAGCLRVAVLATWVEKPETTKKVNDAANIVQVSIDWENLMFCYYRRYNLSENRKIGESCHPEGSALPSCE
jgi:hypothetical protein